MLRVVRQPDLEWRPWKNGAGLMADVAVSPDGADFDRADWRVSVAKVEKECTFSLFPGLDRGMILLSGDSLHLDVAADERLLLMAVRDWAIAFPGDARCHAVPASGPVENLNVMVRRGVVQHRLLRWACKIGASVPVPARGTTILYVDAGEVEIASGTRLARGDFCITSQPLRLAGYADLIEADIWPSAET